MCGIFGFWNPNRKKISHLQNSLPAVDQALSHRGPDSHSHWASQENGLVLGHRRLAIIDLSPTGHQPMVSPDGRFRITFNGEIYNYLDLREELQKKGHSFKGTSDTEVLLAAFIEWGLENTLPKLNGMFAFALWDSKLQKVFLGRDPIGEKPLYYGIWDQTLIFASEIKAFEALNENLELNLDALQYYFELSYIPHPHSIYQNIFKLSPGKTIEFSEASLNASKGIEKTFFEPSSLWDTRPLIGSAEENIRELQSLLENSIKIRTLSDRPIGAFLSGGIDSSLIVSLLQKNSTQKIKTFSIGFDDKQFDEAPLAKQIASHLGADHQEFYVTEKDCLKLVPELPTLLDEPLADSSFIPTYLISKLARQKVVVALSGDGGDEVFGGYPRYQRAIKTLSLLNKIPFKRSLLPLLGNRYFSKRLNVAKLKAYLLSQDSKGPYPQLLEYWQNAKLPLLKNHKGQLNPVEKLWESLSSKPVYQSMLHTDLLTFLPEQILAKLDRASMAVSLETRIPLLDLRIIRFSYGLSSQKQQEPKWILKQLLNQQLPANLINKKKQGFSPPIRRWLQGSLKDWANSYLDSKKIKEMGIFNLATIEQSWNSLSAQGGHNANDIWNLVVFLQWFETRSTRKNQFLRQAV